jgi:hypothetical protein
MTWVPGHSWIEANEVADQFRRTEAEYPTLGIKNHRTTTTNRYQFTQVMGLPTEQSPAETRTNKEADMKKWNSLRDCSTVQQKPDFAT